MSNIFSHFGTATMILEYDHTFSLLGYGLFGLLIVSGSMIAHAAIRHYLSQPDTQTTRVAPRPPEYRKAA